MTTPSTAVGGMWKSRPIVGSATLTIVMSMMFMNMADTNTVPTAIFWFMRRTATRLFLSGCNLVPARRGGSRQPASSVGLGPDPMRSVGRPRPGGGRPGGPR